VRTLVYVETAEETLEVYADEEMGGASLCNTSLEDPEDQGWVTVPAQHLRATAFALLELAGDKVQLVAARKTTQVS
jgi:hypothetical protein